jgi:predicted lipoprotein with Yx(FWY)xxD motif
VGETGVTLTVRFTTPSINLDDDTYIAHDRPVTYVHFNVSSVASSSSDQSIRLYMDTTAESTVKNVDEQVAWFRNDDSLDQTKLLIDMMIGTTTQDFATGTDDRINWGYSHLSVPAAIGGNEQVAYSVMSSDEKCRSEFINGNSLSNLADDTTGPRACDDNWPVLAVELDLSLSGDYSTYHEGVVTLALDQGKSIYYFGTDFLPYWRGSDGSVSAVDMISDAAVDVDSVLADCAAFDDEMAAAHEAVGGSKYATLTSLVYRQVTGGIEKIWNPVYGVTFKLKYII